MISETGKSFKNSLNNPTDEIPDKIRKNIETYSIIALFCLITAIILISFSQKYFALFFIIAGGILGIVIVKNTSLIFQKNRESLKAVTSLNEKKDDVITDFSHRIREPLNNLVIIVDMLMKSDLNKKQKDLLETFIASTNNMVTTVNELTMQTAGNISYESRKPIRFNLMSTIQNTIELYNLKDNANIDFILNKKEFSDFETSGDPIILKQIFLDLFNTIENHSTDRITKVTINLKKEEETVFESNIDFRIQTDKNLILIDDTGADQSLAARLISIGKGKYSQEFGANHTILHIRLPFFSQVYEPVQKTASPKIEELKQKVKIHKEMKELKILLVEDNLINQKIIFLTLKPLVNSIDTASNGKEALDRFGTVSYDLILMDIQMPVMNGLIAAEKIRELESTTNSHVPIIAITANAMIGDKEKCLSVGIDDYISKPFQPAALIDKIKNNI